VKESIWESRVRENANKKGLGLCYRSQGDVQIVKEKDLSSIQKQEGRSLEFCGRPVEKEVYQTIEIPSNITSFLCGQEEWE